MVAILCEESGDEEESSRVITDRSACIAQSRTLGTSGNAPIKSRGSSVEAHMAKLTLVNSIYGTLGGSKIGLL
jgi:hypothetical protein